MGTKKITCSVTIEEKEIKKAIKEGQIDPLLNKWVIEARASMFKVIEKYVK